MIRIMHYILIFLNSCSDVPRQTQLRRVHTFACSEKCGLAFNTFKSLFPSKPVLVTPDFSKQFRISIEVNNTRMGAVLTQLDDNQVEHPVSYHSQKFHRHEKNYSTVEKEIPTGSGTGLYILSLKII